MNTLKKQEFDLLAERERDIYREKKREREKAKERLKLRHIIWGNGHVQVTGVGTA